MLIFHGSAEPEPMERTFRVSMIPPASRTGVEDVEQVTQEIIRQQYLPNRFLAYAITTQQSPGFIRLIQSLYDEYRSVVYRLLSYEFTSGYQDGAFIHRQLVEVGQSTGVDTIQMSRAAEDGDLEHILKRADTHQMGEDIRVLAFEREEHLQMLVRATRQLARNCAMK